jgi:hypothetical protein
VGRPILTGVFVVLAPCGYRRLSLKHRGDRSHHTGDRARLVGVAPALLLSVRTLGLLRARMPHPARPGAPG